MVEDLAHGWILLARDILASKSKKDSQTRYVKTPIIFFLSLSQE